MDALARHGVVVSDVIAGESACDDPSLIANALHLVAVGPDDPEPRDVFIYAFPSAAGRAVEAVDACQARMRTRWMLTRSCSGSTCRRIGRSARTGRTA